MNKTCQSIRDIPGIRGIISLVALLGFLTAYSGTAEAAGSPWVIHDEARVRLIAAADTSGQTGDLKLGIHFKMEPGWKINWRFVGDAGVPTSVDWTESENLLRPEIIWPVPLRFSIFGLETFGYSGEVVLPIKAEVERVGEAISLRATVKYLVCKDICIPHDDVVALDLHPGAGTSSPEGFLISRFHDLVPGDGSAVGLSLENVVLTGLAAESLLRKKRTAFYRTTRSSRSSRSSRYSFKCVRTKFQLF